jgi:hypothetical protein
MVWDSNYVAVWHMNGTATTEFDSTSNSYDLTNGAVENQTGKIGKCYGFVDEDNDNMINSDIFATEFEHDFTIETWFKPTNINQKLQGLACKYHQSGHERFFFVITDTDKLRFFIEYDQNNRYCTHDLTLVNNSWYYGVARHGYNTAMETIINLSYASGDVVENIEPGTYSPFMLGNTETLASYYYDGLMDEVRISKVERNSSWITTSYNTMNDPSSFLTIGPEE